MNIRLINKFTYILLGFFIGVMPISTAAFDRTTDSIHHILKLEKNDTLRLQIMNKFAESQIDRKTDYAITLATEALSLAQQKKHANGIGKSLNILSWAFYRKGDYTKAFDFGIKGLKQNERIHNLSQLAVSYRNVGSVYNSQANYKLSIAYFQKDLELHKEVLDPIGIGRALNNLAFTHFKAGFIDSAKLFIQRALVHNSYIEDQYLLAFTFRNFGEISEHENKLDSAFIFYNRAIKAAKLSNNLFLVQSSLFRKGRLLTTMLKYAEAIKALNEAKDAAYSLGSKSGLSQIYKQLAIALEKTGDFKEAYKAQSAYSKINDTLFEESSRSKLNQLYLNFEAEKKQAEIELLNKEKRLHKIRLHNQLLLVIFLIFLIVFATTSIVIIWRKNTFKKIINAELSAQKSILEESSVLKDKIFSIISHDLRSPIASLSAVLPLLDRNSLDEEVFNTIKKNISKQLSSLNFTLDNLLLWAKTQWKGSTPPNTISFTIAGIIENNVELLKPIAANKKIMLTATIDPDINVWADKQQIDIIIRNLILNAIKFTNEKGLVVVNAKEMDDIVCITISDNGVGMTVDQLANLFQFKTHFTTPGTQKEKGTGLGLLLCKEYALLNKGDINLQTEPGEGTIASLTLPKTA
jgi:two-component system, sensor histidine kinase and response regulator